MEKYTNLFINEDEGDCLILNILNEVLENNKRNGYNLCLLGSFLTSKKINFMVTHDTLTSM